MWEIGTITVNIALSLLPVQYRYDNIAVVYPYNMWEIGTLTVIRTVIQSWGGRKISIDSLIIDSILFQNSAICTICFDNTVRSSYDNSPDNSILRCVTKSYNKQIFIPTRPCGV